MNQPRCQCFCQPPAPANNGIQPPRQTNAFQNPPAAPANFAFQSPTGQTNNFQNPPANFGFQAPRQTNNIQNPPLQRPPTSPRFLTNPFSQVEGPLFVNRNSDRRNSIRLAFNVNQPQSTDRELFVRPGSDSSVTENAQVDENPLFLRRSDRRNAIRMNINVNQQPQGSELFVSPSESSSDQTQTGNSLARALDLGIALFV